MPRKRSDITDGALITFRVSKQDKAALEAIAEDGVSALLRGLVGEALSRPREPRVTTESIPIPLSLTELPPFAADPVDFTSTIEDTPLFDEMAVAHGWTTTSEDHVA